MQENFKTWLGGTLTLIEELHLRLSDVVANSPDANKISRAEIDRERLHDIRAHLEHMDSIVRRWNNAIEEGIKSLTRFQKNEPIPSVSHGNDYQSQVGRINDQAIRFEGAHDALRHLVYPELKRLASTYGVDFDGIMKG